MLARYGCRCKCIDLMCLTESWHRPTVCSALNEACLAGYSYCISRQHAALVVKVVCLSAFTEIRIYLFYLLLNCLPANLLFQWHFFSSLRPWPPKPYPNFNHKFPKPPLYILSYGHNMILEDLNIYFDSPSCCNVTEFIHLLDCNILMFLHTSEAQLWARLLPALHSVISDHMVVSLELPHLSSHCRTNHQISFRNIKNIHPVILATNL